MVADSEARQQLAGQVIQWEENLERLHCEQFRLRCYMASLQSGELPNPKVRENFIFVGRDLDNGGACDYLHVRVPPPRCSRFNHLKLRFQYENRNGVICLVLAISLQLLN